MGKYKVPHFDAKGESDAIFRDSGVPTTFLLTSFYWDNLIHFGMGPKRGADGRLAFTLPMGDKKLPGIAAEDIGKCAYGVFRQGGEYLGRTVGVAGEHLTGAQMAAELGKAFGSRPRLSRGGRPRQHVPVQARFRGLLLRRARPGGCAIAKSGAADVRRLARDQQGPHAARLAPARRPALTAANDRRGPFPSIPPAGVCNARARLTRPRAGELLRLHPRRNCGWCTRHPDRAAPGGNRALPIPHGTAATSDLRISRGSLQKRAMAPARFRYY